MQTDFCTCDFKIYIYKYFSFCFPLSNTHRLKALSVIFTVRLYHYIKDNFWNSFSLICSRSEAAVVSKGLNWIWVTQFLTEPFPQNKQVDCSGFPFGPQFRAAACCRFGLIIDIPRLLFELFFFRSVLLSALFH